jgi:uncharacterized protein with PQ loop repeat
LQPDPLSGIILDKGHDDRAPMIGMDYRARHAVPQCFCVPLLALFAYFPQWKKIIANKSSKDISLTSWLVWLLSSAIAIFYAVIQYQVTGKGTALVFSSIVVLIFVFITVCLIALYRKNDKPKA